MPFEWVGWMRRRKVEKDGEMLERSLLFDELRM